MLELRQRCSHRRQFRPSAFFAQSFVFAFIMSAHAEVTAQEPYVPAATITVNVESGPANVTLSDFDVQLLALVTPSGGVWTPTGAALDSGILPAKITDDYFARARQARDPSKLNHHFAAILVIAPKPRFTDYVSVAWHGSAGIGNGILYPGLAVDNRSSQAPTSPFAVFLPVTLCSNKNRGKVDLKTVITYGPALESFDINLNGPVAPHQFAGMNVNAFVWLSNSSPGIDPDTGREQPARPFVELQFDQAKAMPGIEVQAVTREGKIVRATNPGYFDRPPDHGKAIWIFDMHGENSAALFRKFVVRAYRVQPIIWTGITLPPGTTPYFDERNAGGTPLEPTSN